MKVSELLKIKGTRVITVGPNDTIYAAIQKLAENNIGALPVCDDKGMILGIISERDLLKECYHRSEAIQRTKVKEVMTKDIVIGLPEDTLDYVVSVMTQKAIRHLPIMSGAKVEGIVSMRDIVEAQLQESMAQVRYLGTYISGGYS